MTDHVMAKNPANGHVVRMSPAKFRIMQRSGWTEAQSTPPSRSGSKAATGGLVEVEKENG
ncbi:MULTISPECIES: hypothetical protein [Pseudonocardia]|uniref:Uncharacterized protein n=2 Tax=Pseudonocardia TaxID=1847 RepID=A0A1Y2N654_PSEAH|nr:MULTISPECIES: hypothetical protein [Pseudonocardia]OSY42953.1 hypothetical protein BG845_01195 [Pseudonocardia autotrophica]TDN77529.1 hypothetical protein C8E95_6777 [Pseudonocardia autotrophica]BBG01557.1 hypothetical protein Pdca_27660 [Pseudonocardia autotrophica]GEC29094.1 hypothetical protein PSA01_61230 [Pseudonocardia saturnea]